MTQRESEILQIIRENPLISQNHLAQRLEITRSAVSAYLNTMYKKGMLAGRGYIISESALPVLVGPSHVDIRNACQDNVSEKFYSSLRTQVAYGGPIKNIAEYLINFGVFPKVIFSIANDSFGNSFLDSCKQTAIDVSGSVFVQNATSPVYIEMADQDSHIIAASIANDNLASHITPAHLLSQRAMIKDANTIMVHDSIPVESVSCLRAINPQANLLLVASQLNHTTQQKSQFKLFHTAVLSYHIAFEIATIGDKFDANLVYSQQDLLPVVTKLKEAGLSHFYIMLDQFSICYCNGTRLLVHRSENPFANESPYFIYRYCRDTFSAILIYALENQLPPSEVLDLMAASRNLTCAPSTYFSCSLTISSLKEHIPKLLPTVKTILL